MVKKSAEVSRETLEHLLAQTQLPFTLREEQKQQLASYAHLLRTYNERVNLISRKSADELEKRHLLHSLSLGLRSFPAGSEVVDWGTGGGLPGIPLAILFPEIHVHLVDSIAKKTRVVQEIIDTLGLPNVKVWNVRAEHWPEKAHYAVSRATAPLQKLWKWYHKVQQPVESVREADSWEPGLLALKGGDLSEEIRRLKRKYPHTQVQLISLEPVMQQPYFAEKYLVHVTASESRSSEQDQA